MRYFLGAAPAVRLLAQGVEQPPPAGAPVFLSSTVKALAPGSLGAAVEAIEVPTVAGATKMHGLAAAVAVVEAKTLVAQGPPFTEGWTMAAGSATLWMVVTP